MTRKARPRAYYWEVFGGGQVRHDPLGLFYTGKRDLRDFDELRFYRGRRIEDWPVGVTFVVEGQREEHYLVVGLHWLVVSDRVRQILQECDAQGVQFLPVHIVLQNTGGEVGPYWALNVFQEVDALDWERTRWLLSTRDPKEDPHPSLGIIREALRYEAVKDLDIFRLKVQERSDTTTFISGRVKRCLERGGATSGFSFKPIPAY